MNSALSLWKKPVNEGLKNLGKQHVNGEKLMVATKKGAKQLFTRF